MCWNSITKHNFVAGPGTAVGKVSESRARCPGYFRFSFCWFKKGSCQLLAKVCARSTSSLLRRYKPAQEKCGYVN